MFDHIIGCVCGYFVGCYGDDRFGDLGFECDLAEQLCFFCFGVRGYEGGGYLCVRYVVECFV